MRPLALATLVGLLSGCFDLGSSATGTWTLDRIEKTDKPYNFKPVANASAYRGTPSFSPNGFSLSWGFNGTASEPAWSGTLSVSWQDLPNTIKPGSSTELVYVWNASSSGTVPSWGSCVGGVTGPSDSDWGAGRLDVSIISARMDDGTKTFRDSFVIYGDDTDHDKPEVAVGFSVYCGDAMSPNDGCFGGETRRYVYRYVP